MSEMILVGFLTVGIIRFLIISSGGGLTLPGRGKGGRCPVIQVWVTFCFILVFF